MSLGFFMGGGRGKWVEVAEHTLPHTPPFELRTSSPFIHKYLMKYSKYSRKILLVCLSHVSPFALSN